ncbi:hypothetical protein TRFO_02813 [Tritrichomonas foetus]|uniref:DUF3447 domain-containing protein n=1 Tax=Tritrichomonas foetus TaxID=1144522 RepID=A0A1J4L0U9_9EUKA|nr:hypothetical protein TRFO_02813 [Tritrichomonas foetus]|eukprot:OHT15501.1 hypothetical protein TRFO_02813 [Tritrichomonas foetus]
MIDVRINSVQIRINLETAQCVSQKIARIVNSTFPPTDIINFNIPEITNESFIKNDIKNVLNGKCINLDINTIYYYEVFGEVLQIPSILNLITKWKEYSSKPQTDKIDLNCQLLIDLQHRLLNITRDNFDGTYVFLRNNQDQIGTYCLFISFYEIYYARPFLLDNLVELLQKLGVIKDFASFCLKHSNEATVIVDRKRSLLLRKLYFLKLIDRSKISLSPFCKDSYLFYEDGNNIIMNNPSAIAEAIRNDNLKQFVYILNTENMSMEMNIPKSTFETCDINIDIPLICYSAFYSAKKCFDLLLNNKVMIPKDLPKYAVAGGNFDIIQQCEKLNLDFSHTFKYSVKYHRNDVFDWLFENKRDSFQTIDFCCLFWANYEAFFHLVKKGFLNCSEINIAFLYKIKLLLNWIIENEFYCIVEDRFSSSLRLLLRDYDLSENIILDIINKLMLKSQKIDWKSDKLRSILRKKEKYQNILNFIERSLND